MAILTVAWASLTTNIRDYGSLAQMLLMPLVIIFILGNALSGTFEQRDFGATPVALYGSGPIEHYLADPRVAELLTVLPVGSLAEGKALLAEGTVWGVIRPEETGLAVDLVTSSRNQFRAGIIERTLQGYVTTVTAMASGNGALAAEGTQSQNTFIEEVPISGATNLPSAMDYYAVTMLVMILLYGAGYGTESMAKAFIEPVGRRLKSTPMPSWQLFVGEAIAVILILFAQGALLVAVTSAVYAVNWGTEMGVILAFVLLYATFAVSLGMFVCMVVRDRLLAGRVVSIIVPVFTFLAGGYLKIDRPGPLFAIAQQLSPNYLAQTAFFNSIYGGPFRETLTIALLLGGMIVTLLAATSIVGRRRLQW